MKTNPKSKIQNPNSATRRLPALCGALGFALLALPSPEAGALLVSQTPVSGGGVSRWSQLWQDPGPGGNDLDSDAVCWEDFTLNAATAITHLEWWGAGARELGFQVEFWPQDPGTIAYQPLAVFDRGPGPSPVTPTARFLVTPSDYTSDSAPGGLTHFSLELPSAVALAANDTANPRWFIGIIGLTHQAYYTWNWSQGLGGSTRTFQWVRGDANHFRSLPEGRALLLADAQAPRPLLVNCATVGTNFTFSFLSASNASYTLEYNDDLGTTNWQPLESLTGNGSLMPRLVPMTNATQRLFRLRQP